MTEQEKREKEILDILKDTSNCPEYCVTHRRPWACDNCQAKRIADFILCKEEEVLKETAKYILETIASDFYLIGDGSFELTKIDIQELRQQFGVDEL